MDQSQKNVPSDNYGLENSEKKEGKKFLGKEVDISTAAHNSKSEGEDNVELTDLEDEDEETSAYEEEDLHASGDNEGEDIDSASSLDTASTVYSKLSPFTIRWSFGLKTTVKIINLTTKKATEIFFVASHFGVIYNYRTNEMFFLPGHNYPIQSISSDASGRWLVSADCGDDTVIIIWDHKKRLPVWCLYNVFPQGVQYIKISPDARFLAAINCGSTQMIKFWRWTLGNNEPDGKIELDSNYGGAKHIAFNHLRTEEFAVTMKFRILFCEWTKNKEIKTFAAPFEFPKKKIGTFRETIFLDDNHTALTSTNTGHILFWCDIEYSQAIDENTRGTIEKNHLKTVRIHKKGITSMRLCDNVLVTTSEDGIIYFHDQYLQLMYLVPKLKLGSLVCISFNIADSSIDPFDTSATHLNNDNINDEKSDLSRKSFKKLQEPGTTGLAPVEVIPSIPSDYRKLTFESKVKEIPSDCTIEMRPFIIRDFIFLTKTGQLGYLSHQRKQIKYFLYRADSPVLALGCNPKKNHLLVSYASGWLFLYQYLTKKPVVSVNIPGTKITSILYSNMGHFVVAGSEGGNVMVLDPLLLNVDITLSGGKAPIQKICLSKNDDFLACYDQQSTVHLFVRMMTHGRKKWISMGKYISHYKPISDILFEETTESPNQPRLFTIGQDRMLVEYDTIKLEPNKLKLLNIYRIEQTAIPLSFMSHPTFHNKNDLLISNTEFKLKLVDSKTLICQKTTLGPTADAPIMKMNLVHEPNKLSDRKNTKMIYVTEKQIGIKILPSTGNPFENIGMVAHPIKVIDMVFSQDYKYVFTAGPDDHAVLMWEVNLNAVDVASQIGGDGLEPFLSLIEGGANSFFFREIEDFFYYAQIIHQGEDPNSDRSVSKSLALCEIPDLFRSLGFYPTDYEIENLLYELKHLKFNETGEIVSEISFEDCVKTFLNHKPVQGILLSHINKALMSIADLSDPTDILVEKTELYKALEEGAEAMNHKEVLGYLCILLLPKDENNPVPPTLTLNDFATNVLGIDLTISEEQVKQITHAFEYKKNNHDEK